LRLAASFDSAGQFFLSFCFDVSKTKRTPDQ
jgi:hypothetical protein